jgi:hypothetical protein
MLLDFLFTNKVDIALFCETHLNKNIKLNLPGLKIYRSDRDGTKGGGVAIIVRNTIAYYQIVLPQLSRLEATATNVKIKGQQPVTLVASYIPPKRYQH